MKMQLPKIQAVPAAPVSDNAKAPALIVGQPDVADERDVFETTTDTDGLVSAETSKTVPTQQSTQPPTNEPRWGTPPLAPRLAAEDIAKLEELSRTMLEIRSIAVAAQSQAESLRAELGKHPNAIANIHERITKLDDGHGRQIGELMSSLAIEHDHANGLDDEVSLLRHRLYAVEEVLQKHGLPTTHHTAQRPVLKLTQKRRLHPDHEARVDADGAVVLYYNPRQGHDGDDPQDFALTAGSTGRVVWTGYAIEVPRGYVCDVFVGADVVTSLAGTTSSEFAVSLRAKSQTQYIRGGVEVCRLTLRRVEAVKLEVTRG